MHALFDFKRHNSFENENNGKATHSFDPRSPILSCSKKF